VSLSVSWSRSNVLGLELVEPDRIWPCDLKVQGRFHIWIHREHFISFHVTSVSQRVPLSKNDPCPRIEIICQEYIVSRDNQRGINSQFSINNNSITIGKTFQRHDNWTATCPRHLTRADVSQGSSRIHRKTRFLTAINVAIETQNERTKGGGEERSHRGTNCHEKRHRRRLDASPKRADVGTDGSRVKQSRDSIRIL